MPIDTASKRKQASGIGGPPLVAGVTPDATKPIAWRYQAGWSYEHLAAALVRIVGGLESASVADLLHTRSEAGLLHSSSADGLMHSRSRK